MSQYTSPIPNIVHPNYVSAISNTPLQLTGDGTQLLVLNNAAVGSLNVSDNATIGSLILNGISNVTTAIPNDNSNTIASTEFVNTAINTAIQSAISVPISDYTLPTASTLTLGGVKIDGSTITINSGTISASTSYSLPTASTSVLGGVKIDGSTITVDGGVISATPASSYSLPTASTSVLGGVKIDGSSITISSGTISATAPNLSSYAPLASPSLTGTPLAPTATASTNTTQIATTAFVQTAVNTLNVRIVIASGTITHLVTDRVIIVNKTTPATTDVTLMTAPPTGQRVSIKDGAGNCFTYNITITPASGTIDGASSIVLTNNYSSIDMIFNGSNWNIL